MSSAGVGSIKALASCSDNPQNAYWNNATATPDQSIAGATLLPAMLAYAIAGAISSFFNIVCILIFVTNKKLREKYFLFAVFAFANLINTLFMFVGGIVRRHLIFTNQYMQLRSTFECLLQPGPHLQLLGGQLPAIVLLVMDIERFIAVYKPIFFKVYINYRARIIAVIGCFAAAIISLLFGYLSSYLNQATCANAMCAILSAYGLNYSNYNSAIVILLPIIALILNIFTYVGISRLGSHVKRKKELNLVLITLIVTFVDVILIACPNIVLVGIYNKFFATTNILVAYVYVFFCCNSAINLFVYIFLKHDFRDHFLMFISCATLRLKLTKANEVSTTRPTATGGLRVAPSTLNQVQSRAYFTKGQPLRSALS